MKPAIQRLCEELRSAGWGDRFSENTPLAPYTTYRIGGAADIVFQATSSVELQELWRLAHKYEVPWLVLGRGSNVLVADRGVRGLVVINRCRGWELTPMGTLKVASGELLSDVARQTASAGWAGLEWGVGIPGSIGGAVVGNAGAHGGYLGDVLESVTILEGGEVKTLAAAEIGLGYRTSRFKAVRNGNRPLILEATLGLRPGDAEALQHQMAEWMRWRAEHHPKEPSAGSVFKRTARYPAGFLIDQAGLKGRRHGDAQVSLQHANFIVNLGNARASDVRSLVEEIQSTVEKQFGERLELEIEIIGEW